MRVRVCMFMHFYVDILSVSKYFPICWTVNIINLSLVPLGKISNPHHLRYGLNIGYLKIDSNH